MPGGTLPDLRFAIVANDETLAAFNQVRTNGQNAVEGVQRGATAMSGAFQRSNAHVANLGFQLNDIGQGLLIGQSPFQIMIQQGTQVAQVFGQAGAGSARALGLVGGALRSVLSPVSLATFAVIGLGGAFFKMITSIGSGLTDLEPLLKTHADRIKDIRAAYDDAVEGAVDYGAETIAVLETQIRASNIGFARSLERLNRAVVGAAGFLDTLLGDLGAENLAVRKEFEEFTGVLRFFAVGVRDGTADILQLRRAIGRMAQLQPENEAIQLAADKLLALSEDAAKAAQAILDGEVALIDFGTTAVAESARVDEFTSALERLNDAFVVRPTPGKDTLAADLSAALVAAGSPEDIAAAWDAFNAGFERYLESTQPVPFERGKIEDKDVRSAAAGAAGDEADAVAELIAHLRFERELLSLSAVDQEVMNNLRKAGAEATDEQRMMIEAETRALYEQQRAMEQLQEAGEFLGQTLVNAFERLIIQRDDFKDVLADMLRALAQAILQSALLGQGPFGTSLGNLFPTLFPNLFAPRAGGGSVSAGGAYLIGERGPEIFRPGVSGAIAANGAIGGTTINYNIDARGSGPGVERLIVAALRENNKQMIKAVPMIVRDAASRGAL